MTKPTNMISAGPERSAISPRLRQSARGELRSGAGCAPAPETESLSGTDVLFSAWVSCMLRSAPCLGLGDRVDELLRSALAGEHLDDAGVQRVSDVLTESGVQPQFHVRSLLVRLHER